MRINKSISARQHEGTLSSRLYNFWRLCVRDRQLIVLAIIPIAWYIIFMYGPMYGMQIAFRDFIPSRGITGSEWIGLKHIISFIDSFTFWRVVRNTLLINVYSLIFGFPIPIILAIMLNEIRSDKYRKFIQTVTYFPNFISTVIVVCMMSTLFAADNGILNFTQILHGSKIPMMNNPDYFRFLYVGSGIWQYFGFSSVLFIAAIAGIDIQMYESAKIDGASRIRTIWHITIPCIMPTIMVRLLLELGRLFTQGAEKVLLMYTPSTYEVADIISTYVYRVGLTGAEYSFGAAVDLFNTVLNFALLIVFNQIARKYSQTSLW